MSMIILGSNPCPPLLQTSLPQPQRLRAGIFFVILLIIIVIVILIHNSHHRHHHHRHGHHHNHGISGEWQRSRLAVQVLLKTSFPGNIIFIQLLEPAIPHPTFRPSQKSGSLLLLLYFSNMVNWISPKLLAVVSSLLSNLLWLRLSLFACGERMTNIIIMITILIIIIILRTSASATFQTWVLSCSRRIVQTWRNFQSKWVSSS